MIDAIPARALDALPLYVLLAMTALLFIACHEAGYRVGRRRKAARDTEAPLAGAIMGATLGLLALMLAFSFGMAGSRFDARKGAVLDEANAVGTTWLRSLMLPSPHSEEVQSLLQSYVDVRLEAAASDSLESLLLAIEESELLHERLWLHAIELSQQHDRSVPVGLFVESLNDLIDLHETRVSLVLRYRIAPGVWLALYFIACGSLTVVGIYAGLSGSRNLLAACLLVFALSSVLTLVVDLDRPGQTLFGVSQDALSGVKEQIKEHIERAPAAPAAPNL